MTGKLGQVRGLGSAKEGVAHWWAQRVTAVALVPLLVWFVVSLVMLAGQGYEATVYFLGSPLVATLMVLLLVAGFYHGALGLKVVIEDYVSAEGAKIALIMLVKFAAIVLGVGSIFAVIKISVGG
jgi:succinate dehydrogenase / fumarate reductase membrane anchor subunit